MSAADFMRQSLSVRFKWGENDCALWAASFVLHETGNDPAKSFRGTYASKFECFQILKESGGLLNLVRRNMSGYKPLSDIGVAVAKDDRRTVSGVFLSGTLHVLTEENSIKIIRNPNVLDGWSW